MMGRLIKCMALAPAAALGVVIGGRFEPLRSLTYGYFAMKIKSTISRVLSTLVQRFL